MASSAGGIGFLVVLGLMAVGYSNAGRGAGPETVGGHDPATCDGVLVVESASGTAHVPGDTDRPDGTATAVCTLGVDHGDEDAVAVVQNALVHCHGEAVTIDGEYGAETARAVTAVQRRAGVAPDGEYGPATAEAMRWPVVGTAGAPDCVPGDSLGAAVDDASPGLPATR